MPQFEKAILLQMLPLAILIIGFIILRFLNSKTFHNKLSFELTGLIPVSLLLIFAGIAHFFYTKVMVDMMPEIIPLKLELVYLTGILELIAAIGLLYKNTRKITGILLIVFLLAILPANISGSLKRIPIGGMDKGASYLWFRIPMQFFFIGWIYYFSIFKNERSFSDER